MNEKCNRAKSFLSVTLVHSCNSHASQVSQKGKFLNLENISKDFYLK